MSGVSLPQWVLPKKAILGLKPSCPKSKRTRRCIPSLGNNPGAGYTPGTDTISHFIPGGQANQVMDGSTAYWRFTVAATTTSTGSAVAYAASNISLDYTASSFINRLDIYQGSNLVESISRYNVLSNLLYDVTHTQSDMFGLATMVGSADSPNITNSANRAGFNASSAAVAAGGTVTQYYNFCVPLLASMFCLSNTYFPTYALNDDIRVDIVLEPSTTAFVQNGALANATFSVKIVNPEIIVDFIDIEPDAMRMINDTYRGQPISVSSTTYHMYETQIGAGTQGVWNAILPSKVMSAKSYLAVFRDLGMTGVSSAYTLANRINPFYYGLSSFNLNIGGTRYPQRPILTTRDGNPEEYATELQKAFHALWDTQYSGTLTRSCYASANASATSTESPSARGFLLGVNLDNFKNQTDNIFAGVDLSRVSTYLEANIAPNSANPSQGLPNLTTCTSFIYHDIVMVVDQFGNLTSKY